MHKLLATSGLLFLHTWLFGQVIQPLDTTSSDTVYQKRVVERVVYVYAAPEHYLSVGISGGASVFSHSESLHHSSESYSYLGGAFVQYQKGKWLYQAGLNVETFKHSFDYSLPSVETYKSTYNHIDTISWYEVETGDSPERRYITRSYTRDTVLGTQYQNHYSNTNEYTYVQIPLLIGKQLRHGFVCVDLLAGFAPTIRLFTPESNMSYANETALIPDRIAMRRFLCDVQTSMSIRYLLTFESFIALKLGYNHPLLTMNKSGQENRMFKQSISAELQLSYILFEK